MNKLYIIGGSPRCGKTIILNEVLQKRPMVSVSSDAIRAGVRYLDKNNRIDFPEEMIEDVLPWEILVGLIQRYDHQNIPLIAEGVVFTPERVKSLKLKKLELQAVFVGFSSDEFIDRVVDHGKQAKDWVYDNINAKGEEHVRQVMSGLKQKSITLRLEAERLGYPFFSADKMAFNEFKEHVVNFLLK